MSMTLDAPKRRKTRTRREASSREIQEFFTKFDVAALPFGARRRIADEVGSKLPEDVQARLSGLGETPQMGNRVVLPDIQRYIQQARYGEVYWLWGLERDMVINDPHIQAEIGKRIMSFMGQDERIEPWRKGNKDDQIAAEVIEDMIENCDNWREGTTHLASGHIWRISGAEKIFEKVTPDVQRKFRHPVQWRLKKIHPLPWALFNYRVSYYNIGIDGSTPSGGAVPNMTMTNSGAAPFQQLTTSATRTNNNPALEWNPNDWHADLRFYSTYSNGLIDWTLANCYKPDKVRHVLHSAQVACGSFRENFDSILQSLLPIWFYKKNLLDWFARNMERYGSPFAVAQARVNDKNIQDLLTRAFDQASKINALLVPNGTKVDLKEIQVSAMADGFIKGIDACDTQSTKAILGQTLSTTSKGSGMMGGSGVADLHGEVRSEWAQFDKRSFATMERDQIFDQFLEVNGYKGRCKSVRGGMTPANLAVFSQAVQRLAQGGVFISKDAEADMGMAVGYPVVVTGQPMQKMGGNPNDDGS
ncbi:MAG: DUF935 family protein [Patescibacteria group bacterium]|nr:DUF935 family protein [Patescibacteria group bacterium]